MLVFLVFNGSNFVACETLVGGYSIYIVVVDLVLCQHICLIYSKDGKGNKNMKFCWLLGIFIN